MSPALRHGYLLTLKNGSIGAKEIAHGLRALTTLGKDQSWLPSTYMKLLTTAYNPTPGRSDLSTL